ncbi:MAG: GNAT family N-acetyltransferase [Saccharofermentans sp.]|nr:GNAT family N-acetyltransferase [Saccharofermentans sp.]
MNYRLMTIDDYDEVYKMWMSCKGMGFNDVDDSKEGIKRYLDRNPNTSFVAERLTCCGKIITGAILCGHDGRRGIIQHTCVHPDYRHQGIGEELVAHALEALKAEQISKVLLVAFKHNDGANAFWEKQGFTLREDLNYRNKALIDLVRIDT